MSSVFGPRTRFPDRATLADLVEAQVRRTPSATALVAGDEQLTYAELDARADRLARHLTDLGVGPDVPVAVCLGRSAGLMVALLAVLKAGGACMPLDPDLPTPRLAAMLADADPPVVITSALLGARLPPYGGHVVDELDREPTLPAGSRPGPLAARRAGAEQLAYVIYTSGSTGAPKGVALTHRGLVNHNLAVAELYGLGPTDRMAQFCSISFDASVEEIFPTWETGGALVLRPDAVPVLGADWLRWLRAAQITVLCLPTAYWHAWVGDLRALGERVPDCVRLVVVGGERALGSTYRAWLGVGGDRVRWVNTYGPAEASVVTTAYEPPPDRAPPADRDPPIGRPLANTVVRLLDGGGGAVPEGGVGELHVGGVGLAREYLTTPDLTAERYVRDHLDADPAARLYRTGDLARLLPDGNLEFVGRRDRQVKVRGFRVESGEVESALARHPAVAGVAVVAREDAPGDRRLVAYVVAEGARPLAEGRDADGAPAAAELRRFLAERLPAYMVPSCFELLDALPLTAHGKLDHDALPPPGDPRGAGAADWVAPRTSAEEVIAAVFSRALGVERVGADEDFFDLGGHSLLAAQVVADVRQALAVAVDLRTLFEAPTVAGLAAAAESLAAARDLPPPLTAQPRGSDTRIPLTLSQEQMWHLEAAAEPAGLFNVTAQRRFSGPVNERALGHALTFVVDRHEALRTSFRADPGGPSQTVAPRLEVEFARCDLSAVPPETAADELRRRVAAQDGAPFDLARPPLFRACLYRLAGERWMVAVTFDHLICDGTSAYVFLGDLAAAYDAFAAGDQPVLRPLPLQYSDFALWQRGWATEERLAPQLEHWRRKLAGMPRGPALPFDHAPERPSRRIAARPVSVTGAAYQGLRRLARTTGSTVFVVTTAAVQALLACAGGLTDIVLSTTLSGRGRAELEGLVGCFHGVGRIRTDLSGDPAFETVVARTRDTVLGLFEHQDIPFMRVRAAVLPDMPRGGPELLAAVPVELQYFHTAHDEWAPGAGVVERPGPDRGPDELFFRGHLHPLNVTFLDDGTQLWGALSYKVDFYDEETIELLGTGLGRLLAAVTADPALRLSELPVMAAGARR